MPEQPGAYVNTFVRRGSRWHLVESMIAGRYITRCGRQMRRGLTGPIETRTDLPDAEYCRQCDRRDRL